MSYENITESDQPLREKDKLNTDNYCEWIKAPNNIFIPTSKITTTTKLDKGIYNIGWNNTYDCHEFIKDKLNLDELLYLPNPVFEEVLNDIEYFWDNEDKFIKYGFTYKRGILLFGEAGCGKTSLTALLSNIVINKKNGLVFSIKNSLDLENYNIAIPKYLRAIESNTPILTLFEDLDGLLAFKESETRLLNILDGFSQSRNIVNIGCTNYPENLKDRILNRPSRFDKRYYIGLPDATVRKFYLLHKIKEEDLLNINIDELVLKTEGLTIAHLGEFIKSVFIFGKNTNESIDQLKNMKEFISSTKFEANKKGGNYFSK